MKLIDSPGTAVMISHNAPRYTQAVQCFTAMQVPTGTRVEHFASGIDLAKARETLAQSMSGEWIFHIDDDHVYTPDLLMRLLARLDEYPDIDVLATHVLRRWPPHYSVAANLLPNGQARIVQFSSEAGVNRVDLTGLGGGAVIRRRAFERVPQPWFTGQGPFTEDWKFCTRLKAAGGTVAVDLDVQVGHITPMAVWPSREASGVWGVAWMPVRDGGQQFTTESAACVAHGNNQQAPSVSAA